MKKVFIEYDEDGSPFEITITDVKTLHMERIDEDVWRFACDRGDGRIVFYLRPGHREDWIDCVMTEVNLGGEVTPVEEDEW